MKARLDYLFDGKVARITLAAPKANVIDREMIGDIDSLFEQIDTDLALCAVVIAADGSHFSFGASIEEHLPGEIEGALARLDSLLRRVALSPAPTIAAVRGQCLGGGFELVLACDLIIAEESAKLGVPEITLGVFPPAASALLPVRIGVSKAAALTLTGKSWTGAEAREHGLVARTAPDGKLDATLEAWLAEDFVPRSPTGLRYAARAVRAPIIHALNDHLPSLDRLYLDEMMAEPDAVEGIRAFMEKRPPRWGRKSGE